MTRRPLEHFIAEAEERVPHLSAEQRMAWAEHCHACHPGFTEEPLVAGGSARTVELAESAVSESLTAEDVRAVLREELDKLPAPVVIVRFHWVWKALIVIALLLICADLAKPQQIWALQNQGTTVKTFVAGKLTFNCVGAGISCSLVGNNTFTVTVSGTAGNYTFVPPISLDGSNNVSIATSAIVPSMTGNSGKFLTTNGTASSWASLPTNSATATASDHSPTQCTAGQYATGVATSWAANCAQVGYSQLSGTPTLPANTTATATQFFTAYNSTTGAFTKAQPAFTDLSGTASVGQIPTLTAAKISDFSTAADARITTATGVSVQAYDLDLDGLSALSTTGLVRRTGAGTYTAAALSGSDLPNPSAIALGGVQSKTCTGTDKISAIGTDGVPVCTTDQTASGGGGIATTTAVLKGDNAGNAVAATAGTDYVIPAGNVATATALAANPTDCAANQYASAVDASGNLTCSQVAYTQVTGTPTIPTAYTSNPAMDGTASAGASANFSRGDHVHPTDTTRAAATASTTVNGQTCQLGSSCTVTADPSSAQYKVRICEIHVWGSGASQVLQDADDEAASCRNKYGATLTIQAVECWANAGSPTVTPIITSGTSTSILTGALTCGTGTWAAGTLNGTPTLASDGTIDANITTAGGTATNVRMVFKFTL